MRPQRFTSGITNYGVAGEPVSDVGADHRQRAVELCIRAKEKMYFPLRLAYKEAAFVYMELAEQVERQLREKGAA
jgi:hypothetical protein